MDTRRQAQLGVERLAGLLRAQSVGADDGTPSLHPAQRAALNLLNGQPRGLRAGELAARLGVSAASISDTVRTLEERGWLQRKPDPDDGRAWRLSLTRAGSTLALRLQAPSAGLGPLLQALPEHDVGAFLRAMQLMIGEAQRLGIASGTRTCLGCEFFRPYASDDPRRPHFCTYIGAPFGDPELRIDCPEQQPRSADTLDATVQRFRDAGTG